MIPKRKPKVRSGIRDLDGPIRLPSHRAWIRGFECSCKDKNPDDNWACHPVIECAHVRSSGEGGVGMKPGDNWTIPLCNLHHMIQHLIGEREFEKRYGIDMQAIAKTLWAASPHRKKYELKQSLRTSS